MIPEAGSARIETPEVCRNRLRQIVLMKHNELFTTGATYLAR
ncbi:hypothetical protein RSSM_03952 [Rhodopirellula sallentina SM41]|uniref:Uncharacterized protein n=1 Tax=Rhodopirellula sallentina SM41 TaxID=1263870 RepID=M5U9Q3_9BACT|nr:hypothetical protein RSSM_03952 [Rhodopirellula sallentina SM41]